MDDNLENLNEKLDQFLLEFFEKLEALEGVRNDLTNAMRNGFLSMSKARYSMGNKAVGEMQYARDMTASTLVYLERDGCLNKDDGNKVAADCGKFVVSFDAGETKNEINKGVENLVKDDQQPVLRQRGAAKSQQEVTKEVVQGEKSEVKFASGKKRKDPLKWFGVLVPSSLKDCQRDFKTACCLSCEVAQLERDLGRIMCDYEQLKEKKKIVLSSTDKDK